MKDLLKKMTDKLKTLGLYLWNKGVAIVLLALVISKYLALTEVTPFAEVIYAFVLVVAVAVGSPLVRLVMFPTAARFAESGGLASELESATDVSPRVKNYWVATIISYSITALCVSSLL